MGKHDRCAWPDDAIGRLQKREHEAREEIAKVKAEVDVWRDNSGELEECVAKLKANALSQVEKCKQCALVGKLKAEVILVKEQMDKLSDEKAELRAEIERRGELLEGIVDECQGFGYPDYTRNAAGQPVSMEPTPLDMVSYAIKILKTEVERLKGKLTDSIELCTFHQSDFKHHQIPDTCPVCENYALKTEVEQLKATALDSMRWRHQMLEASKLPLQRAEAAESHFARVQKENERLKVQVLAPDGTEWRAVAIAAQNVANQIEQRAIKAEAELAKLKAHS